MTPVRRSRFSSRIAGSSPSRMQRAFPSVHEREGMENGRDAVTDELRLEGLQRNGQGKNRARPRLDLLLDAVVVQVDETRQEEPSLPVHLLHVRGQASAPCRDGRDPTVLHRQASTFDHRNRCDNADIGDDHVSHDRISTIWSESRERSAAS